MNTLLKIILGLTLIVIMLVVGAAVVLMTVDPNAYKSQISAAVKEATGRDLTIAGDIEVLYYPVLGFKASGLEISNLENFSEKDFVKAGEVQAGVKIMPLLSKKIEITTVRLVKPQITVVKNADGKTNLELPKRDAAENAETPKLDISIEGIEVSNAHVTYLDKATGKTTSINPLNLKIPGYASGRDIDLSLDMVLNNPSLAKPVRIDVKTTMKIDTDQGVFIFRNLKSDLDLGSTRAKATAQVTLNTKTQEISIKDFDAGWQGTSVKGHADIQNFASPDVTFDLFSPSIDIDALLPKKAGAPTDNGKQLLPVDLLRKLSLGGTLAVESLKVSGLLLNDLKINVTGKDGLLKAEPLTVNLYDGIVTSYLQIDARNNSPAYTFKGNLKGMEVGEFIAAKMGGDYLTGIANVAFDLSSRGNTINALHSAAGGAVDFDFGKGYINKWQLSKLMNQAISYFESGKLDPNAPDKIYFTSLNGAFTGQNGIFRNDNLQMIAPKSHALGSGTVNLAAQTVDYTVRVGGGDNPEKFGKKKHIPVRIQGPLKKPSYLLDVQALIEDVAGEKIEEKKQELIKDLFKKLDEKTGKADAVAPSPAPVAEPVPAVTETPPPIAAPKEASPVPTEALSPAVSKPDPVEQAPAAVAPSESAPEAPPEAPAEAPKEESSP